MIEIQIFSFKKIAAVLTGIPVAFKNIMPGKLDFLLGQPIKHHQKNDTRNANLERNRMNAFGMWLLPGKILPLAEIKRLKRAIVAALDDVRMTFKQKC